MKLRRIILPLTVALLSLAGSWQWWITRFIWTADGRLHLLRIYELDRALQQGILYPRWAPDLYFGYGYPVFNFYPPLGYYIVEAFHIVGLDLLTAMKLGFALCFMLAGLGAFWLGRELYAEMIGAGEWSELAGLLSGVAYAFSPYLIIDVYTRGAMAEALAIALLPFFLLALRRLILGPNWSMLALAGLTGALFLISHNLTALFAAPFVAGFVLVKLLALPTHRARVEGLGRLALAGFLALGLAGFYWIPEFFELPLVYVGQPAIANPTLHQRLIEHFLSPAKLVQFSWLYQYVDAPWPLSLAELVLGAAGLLTALRSLPRRLAGELLYLAGAVVVVTLAESDWARPVWLALPSLWVIQFTWRLTVFWVLPLALLTGLLGVALARWLASRPVLAVAGVVLLTLNLVAISAVNLKPQPWNVPSLNDLDVSMIANDEAITRVPGASFFAPPVAEYLPFTVRTVPLPALELRQEPEPAPTAVPQITLEAANSNRWYVRTNAPAGFTLTLRTFYYPDWKAQLDGKPVQTFPATENGILAVDVPAGTHRLELVQGSSPWAERGWWATALGLILLGLVCFQSVRRRERSGVLVAVALGLLLPFVGLPLARTLTAQPPTVTPVQVDVDPNLRLIGYGAEQNEDKVLLHLYWQVKGQVPEELPVRVQLMDAAGNVRAERQQYARFGSGWAFNWKPNELAADLIQLALPGGSAPAAYTVQVGWGDGPLLSAGALTLDAPGRPVEPVTIASSLEDVRFGSGIQLLGYSVQNDRPLKPGDTWKFTLYWQTTGDLLKDYTLSSQLLDANGKFVAETKDPPGGAFPKPSQWLPGRTVSDTRELNIPGDAPPGLYQLVVLVNEYHSSARLPLFVGGDKSAEDYISLSQIKLAPPPLEHAAQHPRNVQLGDAIRLVGTNVAITNRKGRHVNEGSPEDVPSLKALPSQTLSVDLLWQKIGNQAIGEDYTVFIHVVDASGKIVAQQDNMPVGGSYPTTLWGTGETITDRYAIPMGSVLPGHYQVLAGMYVLKTGARLSVRDAQGYGLPDNSFQVANLVVEEGKP